MKILVALGTNYGYVFWDRFCEYGHDHYGHTFYAIAKSQYMFDQFMKHKKSKIHYELAGTYDHLYSKYGKFAIDKEKLTRELREFEQESGTVTTDIIQADRNVGRGYYYAGHGRPASNLSKIATYWDTLQFIYEYKHYFEEILDRVCPDVITIETGSVEANTFFTCAHKRNIPVRRLSVSRYKNLYHWSFSEKEDVPYFKEFYQSFEYNPELSMEKSDGYKSEEVQHEDKKTVFSLIKPIVKNLKYRVLSSVIKSIKGESKLLDTPIVESIWVWYIKEYFQIKKLKKINQRQTLSIKDQPYVYYPLHIEPEDTLSVCAPEFNNQVGVIDMLAKSLPAGVILVVKEHKFGISMRPKGFYEWLESVPNVYVASLDMSSPELARNSLVTATITGTAGLEAAVAGVPVVAFSHHILFSHIKHVHVVTDFLQLRELMLELVNTPQDMEENKKEGQRYLQAVSAISMDFGDENIRRIAPSDEAEEKLWDYFHVSIEKHQRVN